MTTLVRVSLLGLAALLLHGGLARAEDDLPGSKDPPLFNRMPGFFIRNYSDKDFDTHEMRDAKLEPFQVEGHVTQILYVIQPGAKEPSRAQVLRNYENAIKAIGGKVLYSDYDGSSFLTVVKDGKEIWVEVSAYVTFQIQLFVIEKQAMAQEIVANADVFKSDLASTGHAAVYGIYFDTSKAVVKPESQPALAEIAKLLAANPGLKLHVVGHTDSVGTVEANLKLSQARAEAVVQELVTRYHVAPARLRGYGVSSLAPVAPNDSDAGRAKNRRVELVKQ